MRRRRCWLGCCRRRRARLFALARRRRSRPRSCLVAIWLRTILLGRPLRFRSRRLRAIRLCGRRTVAGLRCFRRTVCRSLLNRWTICLRRWRGTIGLRLRVICVRIRFRSIGRCCWRRAIGLRPYRTIRLCWLCGAICRLRSRRRGGLSWSRSIHGGLIAWAADCWRRRSPRRRLLHHWMRSRCPRWP